MKLSDLLWVDEQYSSDIAQIDCFGDRCLCCTNELFATLRRLYLSLGFTFTSDAGRLWRDYDAAPLFMLNSILAERVVPFKDTSATVKKIALQNPRMEMNSHSILMHIKRNYLLHESAHCVSDSLLRHIDNNPSTSSDRVQFVLKCVACEAFATTVERMTHAFVDAPVQILFLNLNSYVEFAATKRRLLKDALIVFGFRRIFGLAFLYLLYLNTHDDPPNDVQMNTFLEAVPGRPLSSFEKHTASLVCRTVFTLNGDFRNETSALFFDLLECKPEFTRCADLSFTAKELESLNILTWLRVLSSSLFDTFEVQSAGVFAGTL